jgi:hypothetical protein
MPKKPFFRFSQNNLQAMDEVENFLADFQIPRSLGCQRWAVMPQNVKKP